MSILRRISLLILAATVFGASAAAAADPTAEIRKILHAQQQAWNRGDIDGFMNGYARSKSITFVSEDTVKRGYGRLANRARSHLGGFATALRCQKGYKIETVAVITS